MVHRDLDASDPLAATLDRNAITAGADTRLRFKDRTYEAAFNVGFTFLDGEPAAIARVQRASGHYLQRLDQPDIRYDPTRTTLGGTQIQGSFNKIAGRHWLWGYNMMIEIARVRSARFRPAELRGRLRRRTARHVPRDAAGPLLPRATRSSSTGARTGTSTRDLGVQVQRQQQQQRHVQELLGGVAELHAGSLPRPRRAADARRARPWARPRASTTPRRCATARGRRPRWSGNASFRSNEFGDGTSSVSGSVSARPSPSIQFSFEPEYSIETGTSGAFMGAINRQYLTQMSGGQPGDLRPPLHLRCGRSHDALGAVPLQLRVQAGPDARRLRGAVRGERHLQRLRRAGRVARPRSADLRHRRHDDHRRFPMAATRSPTEPRRSRSRTRLQRPLVPQQRRAPVGVAAWAARSTSSGSRTDASSVPEGQHVGLGDLFGSLSAPGDNIFAIKTTFWISR